MNETLLELKQRQALLLDRRKRELEQAQEKIRFELPHLYGHKFYPWQRAFFDSANNMNIVCAANQIGKSSTGIRRLIANATDAKRREMFFPRTHENYKMQWYFYPDSKTLEREWNSKWVEWMPRGDQKSNLQYGWRMQSDRDRHVPYAIHWNSGITTYFMYYSKNVTTVQASSPHEIFCDEEMPTTFYDELMMRMVSTDGLFNMFYTPTLNQAFWKRVMQKKAMPKAFTREVSMYDCLLYEDGSPSTVFTREKVQDIEARCISETERQRRVYGKHVAEGGRLYYGFDDERNITPPVPLQGYTIYGGMDYGSGGSTGGHPSAIVFIAVAPDLRSGYIFRSWRGDNIETTSGDVVNKYIDLKRDLVVTDTVYDHSAKDLGTIAGRVGLAINRANKAKDYGQELLNTLLLAGALKVIDYGDGSQENLEQLKVADEFTMLMVAQESGDDLTDTVRYVVCAIPWDYEFIKEKLPSYKVQEELVAMERPLTDKEFEEEQIKMRRGEHGRVTEKDGWQEYYDEIQEFNEMCD